MATKVAGEQTGRQVGRNIVKAVLVFVLVAFIIVMLTSCTPPEDIYADPYPILDNETNFPNKDHTTKDEAVERATGSLENLLDYLDSEVVSTTGYYMGIDMAINTDDGSAFILKLQGNMYTWPYDQYEEGTPEYEAALAKHNELIKYNDLLLEWYDGTTNTMLIGFYFDGINTDPADPGNNLYLNLQGSKRIFANFGDTVLYQQMIRLITQLNLETLISSVSSDGSSDSAISSVEYLLKTAVTTNYKLTLNGDETSVYFNEIPLTMIAGDVTEFIQGIFSPFQDKLDPLTYKYLGFLFSTLGTSVISTLNSDMQFLMEPNEQLGKEILTGMDVDFRGNSLVRKKNKQTGAFYTESVPFTMNIAVDYDIRVSQNIVLDRENYKLYETGNYEFIGDMYLVPLDLKLDVLLRTDMNKYDNKINKVYLACRDLATDDLIIGGFYKDELTYIDIEGLQHLYGGVKFEDIGLPKAYKGGFNLASTLKFVSDFVDKMIVMVVDSILDPNKDEEEDSEYSVIMNAIMKNIESTMKDEEDPASHATIKVRIDMPLIKEVMKVSSPTGTNYTTDQIIQLLNKQFNIDLEAIASILGMSVEELLNRSYFDVTYDVDVYSIKLEVYSAAEKPKDAEADLIMRMDLFPTHIGEKVRIAFPNFDNFNELQEVLTYSGYLEGQFVFAQTEEVNLSRMMGAFMGDTSGLNTPYILPKAADIYFTLSYDQYIREQILENGRWTRKGRSAFNLYIYIVENDVSTPIMRIYANDVSFNTAYPVEELGYVWLDYICFPNLPKFKVREDLFITSLYEYMGYDFENETGDLVLGLTDIVMALMEDSWATFEPEVIRLTTSNDSIKQFFGVDELIGTISIMIGFRQRVKNIDQLEKDFAMYSVGTLENMVGESPYSIKLHETVPVYFDFGERMETRDLKFLYNPESIEVVSGNAYYRPRMDKQFMGVSRDYLIYISDLIGRQKVRRLRLPSDGDPLAGNEFKWEPLGEIPEEVDAFYGNQDIVATYDADFNLHAVFDRETEYYTVISPNGYEIVYDYENNVYILGLGSQFKYDKAYEELGPGVTVYLKEFIGTNGLNHVYDLGTRIPGYYIVENSAGFNILYSYARGEYIVSADDYLVFETEIAEGQAAVRRMVEVILGSGATIRTYQARYQNKDMIYDFVTGMYMYTALETVVIPAEGEEEEQTITNRYNVFYQPATNDYYIPESMTTIRNKLITLLGSARIITDPTLIYTNHPYTMIVWDGSNIDKVDWDLSIYNSFEFGMMAWEDLTLEGGKFVVKVVIGEGMMATYRENIVVKVWNRTVLTDLPFININTPDGPVKAPIAMTLPVDPIMYLIYKAYYINGMRNTPESFVEWYFRTFDIRIQFTKIYADPNEETPDAFGAFNWSFDFVDENTIYSEKQINNYVGLTEKSYTYVYTNFYGQIIALRLQVLPRQLDYFMVSGETERNTYTIDALYPSSYVLPTNLTYYFEGEDETEYTLNFQSLQTSTIFSSRPERMPNIGSALSGPNSMRIINWTNPEADNVKLVNARDPETGNPYPFKSGLDNTTSSFFDLSINFDFNRAWYYEDWFYTPELTIEVQIPDKVIDTFTKELITEGHQPSEYELRNIKIKDFYVNGETPSEEDENLGVFNVDPFDSDTWVLPTDIVVFFTLDGGIYQKYEYSVEWRNIEGDLAEHFVIDNDGVFYLLDVTENPGAYYLETVIGDEQSEEGNYIRLRLLIRIMSPVATDVEFLNSDGSVLKNSRGETLLVTSTPGSHDNSMQENLYEYAVDTYDRFDIPGLLRITFKDGTLREYTVTWSETTPWTPQSLHDLYAVIGGEEEYSERIYLEYAIEDRGLISLEVQGETQDICTVTYDIVEREIIVNGLRIDDQGYILYNTGSNARINILGDSAVTVYEYFKYLFGDITATFVRRVSVDPTGEGNVSVDILDAALSAYEPIFGTVDLQKMLADIHPDGQGLDIYIGQGKGADDFTVYMVVEEYDPEGGNELDIEAGQDNYIITIGGSTSGLVLEAYNPDNTPKYPNGYIIAQNFGFTVRYKETGKTVTYSNSAQGARPVPQYWSVVKSPIVGTDPEETWMIGLSEFQIIDRLSEVSIYGGGVIWLSALIEDGSRVYCRFSSSGINIGDNFDSAEGSGRYAINQGLITIENIYEHYSLGTNIIPSRLPSRLVLEGGFEISGISWTMSVNTEYLNGINYLGTSSDVVIATARVMREIVQLKLRVLPCEVKQVSYIDNAVTSRTLISEERNEDGDIIINFDAYANFAYAGNIPLPKGLNFKYSEGLEADRTFSYTNLEYYSVGTGLARLNAVGYNFYGHTMTSNGLGVDPRNIRFRLTLMDGQIVNIILHFNDKTVTEYEFDNIGLSVSRKITLNPYSEYVEVPSTYTLKFIEGPDLIYTANWTLPVDFEVRYDTFRTILNLRPEGQKHFTLASLITGYEGLGYDQPLSLYVAVLPYVIESWSLEEGKVDYYNISEDTHNENPNATYHITDPYAGKTTDLPGLVEDILYHEGQTEFYLPVVWDFEDADIIAEGTPTGHILVRGWIYDKDRGQPVSLKLYIDTWTFDMIRRKQGDTYQSMMQDIRFYFSQVSGTSSYTTYQVAFRIKNVLSGADPTPTSIVFIPEDIDPTTVLIAGTSDYYPANYPYRIKWDEGALARARNALATGGDAVGGFSLTNSNGLVRTVPAYECYYQYETLNLTKVDLGYGYGSQNEAIYVVDPLNPYFGDNYRLPIKAKGNYNLESDVELNAKGLTVTAIWWQTGSPAIVIPDKYVAGGVYKGWAVTVRVENPQTGFSYQEVFRIMLVFLDMSPITYINNSSMSVLNRGAIKSTYNMTTYAGAQNPYEDSYTTSLLSGTVNRNGITDNVLNTALRDYSLVGATLDYTVTEWDPNILIDNNMNIQYSRKVNIRGREYTSNIVRRQYSTKFEINGLDLGYGMGIDSARYDYLSSDPLAIEGKEKTRFILNPLDPDFSACGIAIDGQPYTFILPESRIQGSYEGTAFTPGQFSYRVTWWNESLSGGMEFNSDVASGGYIDHWKVILTVHSGETIQYTHVYNILLFFLDGRPDTEYTINDPSQNIIVQRPKSIFTTADYDGYENPYGEYYTQDLIDDLNDLAGTAHGALTYSYEVMEWGDAEEIEGFFHMYSEQVRIYRTGSNPATGWVVWTFKPFIHKTYPV